MIEISKSELIPLIISHYKSLMQESTFHIYQFQQQYGCTLAEFAAQIEASEEEKFKLWDDYIAWKGHQKSAENLAARIQQIEDGLFEVA